MAERKKTAMDELEEQRAKRKKLQEERKEVADKSIIPPLRPMAMNLLVAALAGVVAGVLLGPFAGVLIGLAYLAYKVGPELYKNYQEKQAKLQELDTQLEAVDANIHLLQKKLSEEQRAVDATAEEFMKNEAAQQEENKKGKAAEDVVAKRRIEALDLAAPAFSIVEQSKVADAKADEFMKNEAAQQEKGSATKDVVAERRLEALDLAAPVAAVDAAKKTAPEVIREIAEKHNNADQNAPTDTTTSTTTRKRSAEWAADSQKIGERMANMPKADAKAAKLDVAYQEFTPTTVADKAASSTSAAAASSNSSSDAPAVSAASSTAAAVPTPTSNNN